MRSFPHAIFFITKPQFNDEKKLKSRQMIFKQDVTELKNLSGNVSLYSQNL